MVKTGYFAMPTGDDKSLVNIYETSFDTEDIRDIISLIQNDESLLVHKSNLSAKDFATSKDIIVKQEIVDYQEITDRNNSKSQKYVYDVDVLESKAATLVKSLFKFIIFFINSIPFVESPDIKSPVSVSINMSGSRLTILSFHVIIPSFSVQ